MLIHHSPTSHVLKSRSRVTRACDRCKIKKGKCNGDKSCAKCIQSGTACTYTLRQSKISPQTLKDYAEQLARQQSSLTNCVHLLYEKLCAEVAHRDQKRAAELESKCSFDDIFGFLGLDPFNTNIHNGEEGLPESPFHPSGEEGFPLPTTMPGFKMPSPPQAPNRPILRFEPPVEPKFDSFELTEALWHNEDRFGILQPATYLVPDSNADYSTFSSTENGTIWNLGPTADIPNSPWMGARKFSWDDCGTTTYDSDSFSATNNQISLW